MRYRVSNRAIDSGHGYDRADVETWFDDPAEAADLYMKLLADDDTAPMSTGHRLLTHLLRGDRSFAVLSSHSYYTIEALP